MSKVIALDEVCPIVFQKIHTDDLNGVETSHVALLSMPHLLVTFTMFSLQRSGGDAGRGGGHACACVPISERTREGPRTVQLGDAPRVAAVPRA